MPEPVEQESPLQYPCDYVIKAMGLAEPDFDALVVGIIRRHAPNIREGAITSRHSSNGKYVSVSVTIEATSRAQLDAIYDDLTAHEKVLMRL